jgi:hypothetical protein
MTKTRNRSTGICHYECHALGDKLVVNYTYHGSSFVHAKEFTGQRQAELAQAFLQELKR